jgi:hypothetical protein
MAIEERIDELETKVKRLEALIEHLLGWEALDRNVFDDSHWSFSSSLTDEHPLKEHIIVTMPRSKVNDN